ncbi:DUF3392 domain-containing protein [Vibrio hannami]|uniref:DUF3392 domain-containing protein n=1 Tax=Vibrio hannami TaxID=2717094 RepID=UPI00240FFBA2|nr:DUF3392 domain-containing protein [Vibrio hannami]MDG3087992.1 DUF3392 domain-containing protein [Vibrio hannami]
MLDVLAPVGKHIYPYIPELSTAMIACFLVMAGNDINRMLRKMLSGHNFFFRTGAFVLLNAFGYGMLIVYATPYLAKTLRSLEPGLMFTLIFSCFILIGMWAQKNRQV